MRDYQSGLIYLITDNTNNNKYVGSTKQTMTERMGSHRYGYKKYLLGERNKVMSFDIFKNGDYTHEVLEYYPCECRRELEKREQYWLDKIDCINAKRAFMTKENRLESARKCDRKRTRDCKPYLKRYRAYRSSWGGDSRTNNNLLSIQLDLFTED